MENKAKMIKVIEVESSNLKYIDDIEGLVINLIANLQKMLDSVDDGVKDKLAISIEYDDYGNEVKFHYTKEMSDSEAEVEKLILHRKRLLRFEIDNIRAVHKTKLDAEIKTANEKYGVAK